jgi:hypothetical protein
MASRENREGSKRDQYSSFKLELADYRGLSRRVGKEQKAYTGVSGLGS